MARGRMVNTSIALDPEFNAMSMEAQMLYLRTVPHLDRDGLILGNPVALWAKVAPLQESLMPHMAKAVDEWVDAGLVQRFQIKTVTVLYFSGFHKNQINMRYDREPESSLPIPDGYTRTSAGLVQDDCRKSAGSLPEDSQQDSCLREEKRREENKELSSSVGDSAARYRHVCDLIQNNGFGMMTTIMADQVHMMLDEFTDEWIDHAFEVAVKANKRRLDYVLGTLENIRRDGIKSKGKSGANRNGVIRDNDRHVPNAWEVLLQQSAGVQ